MSKSKKTVYISTRFWSIKAIKVYWICLRIKQDTIEWSNYTFIMVDDNYWHTKTSFKLVFFPSYSSVESAVWTTWYFYWSANQTYCTSVPVNKVFHRVGGKTIDFWRCSNDWFMYLHPPLLSNHSVSNLVKKTSLYWVSECVRD